MVFFSREITDKEIAQQALNVMKRVASVDRRQNMQKRIDFYNGKQMEYLNDSIDDQFTYPERLKLQKEYYNSTKLVVDELAVLYNEEPLREIQDGTEQDQEIYSEIVDSSKINLVMEEANKLCKLCRTVLIRPVWRKEQIEYDIYTPNIFDVIQDEQDQTKAKAVVYANIFDIKNDIPQNNDDTRTDFDRFDEENVVFYYASKDKFIPFTYNLDKTGFVVSKILKQQNNDDNINPYGMLPFIIIRDGYPVSSFFLEGGDDLINTNEMINVKLTELNHLTKMQAFSVPVRKGAERGADALILDPSMCIDLPADDDLANNADFKFVSPEPKITELQKDIEGKLRRLAIKYKLNPDMFTASAERSSAQSLQLQNYHLSKIIKRDKPYYRIFERELFELTKVIYNYHSSGHKLSENCRLYIDYKDIETPMTMEERDAHNLLLYNNGILSRTRWMMQENPDIRDKDQAMEMLQEIEEEKKERMAEYVNGEQKQNEEQKEDENKEDDE